MKSNRSNRFLGLLCRFFSASAIVMSFFGLAQAAPITKAATGTDLTAGASWTGSVAPTSTGTATWDATSLGAGLTLATTQSWQGIAVTGALTDIATSGVGVLTLGSLGIDASATDKNIALGTPIALGSSQTWNINTGKTLTASGIVSGTSMALTKQGSGTLILSGLNTYTGGTTVTNGVLQLGNAAANGTVISGSTYLLSAGTTLFLNNLSAVSAATSGWATQVRSAGAASGAGTLRLDSAQGAGLANWGPNSAAAVPLHTDFKGTLQLDNGRFDSAPAGLGGLTNIVIKGTYPYVSGVKGGQFLAWAGTYPQNFSLSGDGWGETGYAGALRVAGGGLTANFTGTITLTGDASFQCQDGTAVMNLNGVVSGGFSLYKTAHAGTLNLAGTNTYTGNTTIGTGALNITGAGSLGSGAYAGNITITAGTFGYGSTAAQTLSGVISGVGAVTKSAASTLKLTGTNTYSGVTTISAGTLQIGDAGTTGQLGTGAVTDNATLAFNRTNSLTVANVISGSGALQQNGVGGILILSGANTYAGTTTINAGTLQIGSAGATGQFGTGAVTNSAALVFNRTGTLAVPNAIGGSGTLEQNNASGTTTLSGISAYTGATTVTAGILQLSATGAAAATDITVKGTATLQVDATGKTLKSVTVQDNGILSLPAVASQTTAVTNNLDLSGVTTGMTVKAVFVGGTPVMGTYDLATTTASVIPVTSGTMTLSATGWPARTLAGSSLLVVGGNKLQLTVGASAASLVWNNFATSGLWNGTDTNFDNAGANDRFYDGDLVTFGNTAAGTVTLDGTLSPGAITVNATSNYIFAGSGAIAGATGLVKSGSGTLTINTTNSYTGLTTVNAGILEAGTATAFGAAANASLLFGSGSTGIVRLNGNSLTLAGLNTTGFSTTPIVENGVAGTATLTVNNAAASAYYGVLRNGTAGTLALVKAGAGALTLGGTNTYTGTTTVSGGILNLNAVAPTVLGGFVMNGPDQTFTRPQQAGQFGPGVVASFSSLTGAWNRFEFFGKDQAFAGITTGNLTTQGGGVLQDSETNGAAGANATLLLYGDSSDSFYPVGGYVYNGHLRDYGATTAGTYKLNLVKSGTGTQTLAGAVVSYSGTTTINAGALTLQDTTVFASPVTVGASGTLNVVRTALGFAARQTLAGSAITGSGVINANSPGPGLAGGWVRTSGLNFTGTINVNSGVFGTDSSGVIAGSAVVNVAPGAVFTNHSSVSITIGALNGAGDVTPAQSGGGTYNLTLGANNLSGSYAGIIHGNNTTSATDGTMECGFLSPTKIGTGTQILSGANTYTGATTISEGTLALAGGSAIVDANSITLANVATAKLRLDSNETVEAVTGGGAIGGSIDLQGNTLTLGTLNSSSTFSGAIGGAGGGITKVGTGILTLSGTGTYTGTTTVAAGTLALSGTGVSPIALNFGTLQLTGTTTGTLTAASGTTLSGEGTGGAATLGVDSGSVTTLVADPSTPGALKVGGLTLNGKVSVSLPNGLFSPGVPFTVLKFDSNDSGFLDTDFQLVGGGSYRAPTFVVDEVSSPNKVTLTMGSLNLTWNNNAGGGVWDNSAFNFRSGGADSDFKWGDFVTFNDAANPAGPIPAGAQAINIVGTQQPAGVTITGAANNYTFSGAGKISGVTGLVKSGTSTARFSQANDYTGGTSVTGGILEANAAGALGTGTIVVDGGTLNAMFAGSLGSVPVTLTSGTLNVTIGSGLGTGLVTVNGGTMNASAGSALGTGTVNLAGGTLVVNNATTPFGTATVAAKGGTIQYAPGITADVSASLKNSTSPIRVDTNNNNVTWATALPTTNTAGLTKLGTGILTLTGSSPFTGDVTIQGGAIGFATVAVVGTASPLGAGNTGATALTLDGGTLRYTGVAMTSTNFNRKIRLNAGGGTLELASTGIGWIAGAGTTSVITGPGSFTKTGTQQLIVSGFTDYDGITFINAGELQMRDSARGLGSTVGKTVVASGAQLATGGGGSLGAIFENIDLNGTGSSGGGALQCNDGPTATFAGTITLVTDSAIGGGSPAFVISGPVVGSGKLSKVGTQLLTLSGNNTYTGATTVSAGTLALAGTNVSPVTVTAGTLQLNGSTTGAITVAAAATVAGEGTAPSVTTSGVANLNIDPTTTGAFTATGAVTLGGTLSVGLVGPVTGTGAIKVLNYGTTTATAANFALASPANYRGGATATFTVGAGAVTLNGLSKKSIEWTAGTATWDIATTANFRDTTTLASEKFYTGDDVLFGNLPGVSPTVTITGTVLPSSLTVNSTANYTFTGGTIGGTTSILKSGTGAISLGQANTFTGGMTISQGAVTLTNATAAGTGPITLGDAGTGSNSLTLTASLAATFANPITVTNNGTGFVTIAQSVTASALSGTLTLNRPTIIQNGAGSTSIAGKITGNVGTLTFTGVNTTLSDTVPNDFVGDVVIASGALQANTAGCLPGTASVTLNGSAVLQLTNGISQAINALNGGTAGTTGVQISGGTAATLTVGSNNGSGTFNGNIINNVAALSITKAGTGTQVLNGTLTYTGTTAVSQGTLQLPSESTLTGAVTVANGAALAVGGRAGYSLITTSLTLGTSGATTLAINNLAPAPFGVPLRVNTTLATNGPVTLNVDLSRITATGTYPLIAYPAAGIGGSGFGAFTLGDLPAGFAATLNNNTAAKTIELVVTNVGSLLWVGNNGPAWDVNTTTNWLDGATASKYFDGDKVVFDDTAALFGMTLGVPVAPASVVFNNSINDYTLSGAGGLGGLGTITKTGNAKVTVTTANPTTGLTTITGGTLQLGDASANGSVGGNIYNTANLIFANATAQTYAGVIGGSPFGLLTKTGAGTLTLTGANTCGDLAVSQGTLQLGNGGASTVGSIPATSQISVAAAGTMAWSHNTQGYAVANPISGSGNLLFQGINTPTLIQASYYTLTGTNTGFTGTMTMNQALVQATTAAQLGNGPLDIQSDGTLMTLGAGPFANNIAIAAGAGWHHNVGGVDTVLGALRLQGNPTLTGSIALNTTTSIINGDVTSNNSVISAYEASNATLSGVISGPGDLAMSRFTGTGGVVTISLTGTASNTYLGKTVVDGVSAANATLRLMKTGGAVAIRSGTIVQMGSNTAGQANLRMGDTTTVGATRNQWDNQFGSNVVMNFMTQPAGSHTRFDLQGTNQALAGVGGGTATVQAQAVIQNRGNSGFDPGQDATLTLTGSGGYLFNGWLRDVDNGTVTWKLNLVKSGSGTQTFAGNQITHTGTNTISGGTLVFPARGTAYGDTSITTSGAKLGVTGTSGTVFTVPNLTLASGAKLSVGNFANLTGTNKCIDVTTALTVSGPVTVDLPTLPTGTGPFPIIKYANSYAGTDFVLDAAAWTLPRWLSSPALSNDTTNKVINLTAVYIPLIWAGGTSLWDLTTKNWTLGGNPADYDEGDAVQFDESGTATNPNVVLNTAVVPYAVNFMNTTNPYSLAGTGGIGGAATIGKTGTGTVVIKNANPTTGLTTVTQGTLQLGDGTINGSVGGNIALAGASAVDATLVLNPLSQTYAGIISGTATAGTVSKTGTGTMILTGVNTYAGATNITDGTLQLGDGGIQPTLNSSGYAITAPGTLKIQYNTAAGAVAQTWSKFTGSGTLALATGKFNDAGWGSSTLTTGFTGNLRIEGGRVSLLAATGAATNYGLGAATKVTITNGGHLGMWENGITLPNTMAFEIAGFGYGEGAYEVAIRMANGGGATTTINGPILLTASAALGAQGNGVGTVNGVISGGVGVNLTIGGAVNGGSATGWQDGTIALAAANTFVGKVTVNMGTVRLDHPLALQNNTLNLNGITGNTGTPLGQATFNSSVVGNAFTLGGLEGYRPLALQNTAAAAIALSVGFNNTSTAYTGILSGAGSLLKIGTGTLTLVGASTHTGGTVVNGGTLAVNGTLAAAGAVQVGGDSGTGSPVLTGTGTVGVLTVNPAGAGVAGTVNPGAVGTVGVLTSGAAIINGTFSCDVSGATCDKLVANGNVTLAGPLTITGTAAFSSPVVLIDYSSGAYTRTGTFTSVPAGYSVVYDDANRKVLLSTGGYDSWASQITDVNKRGRGDDADGDGFTNLQEFLFGKNPNVTDGSLSTSERTANGLVIHWSERTTNGAYKLLESTTLAAPWTQWSPTPPTFIMANDGVQYGDANYGFYQPKKATVPLTPSKNFFRIEGVEGN